MAPIATPTFSTARLVFRAVDSKTDAAIIKELNADPLTLLQSNGSACLPFTNTAVEKVLSFSENALLSVFICLPASPDTPTFAGKEIGWMSLAGIPTSMAHHRKTMFGIGLQPDYIGKGYGTEALEWLLSAAFSTCGLNKVEGNAFAWNVGALALYSKIGFQTEGIKRKSMWQEGEFRDEVMLGYLAEDWWKRKKEIENSQ